MSELSKQKEIGENMSDSRQLTTLDKELDNTLRTVKSVDEYLSRIANYLSSWEKKQWSDDSYWKVNR